MADFTYKGQIFKVGNEFTFNVPTKINGTAGATQNDVNVDILVKTNDIADNGKVNISEVSLETGTYTDPTWNLGTVTVGDENLGEFKFTVVGSDVTSVEISATIRTDKNNSNNVITYRWEGTSGDSSHELADEDVFEVPTSAFALDYLPTDAELLTWIDSNLDEYEQRNGTHLVYNSNPYAETITWEDISITLDVSAASTIGSLSINEVTVDISSANDVTSSANFDEAAFKALIEAEITSQGLSGGVVVTDDIDASDEVVITISPQAGIWSIIVLVGSTAYYPQTITKTSITGRRNPDHMWVLNNDAGSIKVSKIYQAHKEITVPNLGVGNTFWVDPTYGSNETGEIGDPDRPFKTLNYVTSRLANNFSRIFYKNHRNTDSTPTIIGFVNLQGMKLIIDNVVNGASALLFLDHGNDADTRIVVTGEVIKSSGSFISGVEHMLDGELVFKDLVVEVNGAVDIATAASGPVEVLCLNVKTNSQTQDANITETGEAIFRSIDILL